MKKFLPEGACIKALWSSSAGVSKTIKLKCIYLRERERKQRYRKKAERGRRRDEREKQPSSDWTPKHTQCPDPGYGQNQEVGIGFRPDMGVAVFCT